MKKCLILILTLSCITTYAQMGVTFKIEELSAPQELLRTKPNYESNFLDEEKIIAQSEFPEQCVVNCDDNKAFFNTILFSYLGHRPLVLSPDMIWLLIEQGFANHVNANHKKLRSKFVDFEGKKDLSVVVEGSSSLSICEQMLDLKWDSVIQQFPPQIAKYTGNELIQTLTADFSTTSHTEKFVSEVTIMKAMEHYFDYNVMLIGCGIPEITLLGTTADWENVLKKTMALSKYDLEWWTKDLKPILEQFILASQNKIDTTFWKKMFKYHEGIAYKKDASFDGWLVNFYPYDKKGKKINSKCIDLGKVPEEIMSVDIKYIDVIRKYETTLALNAGFIGCKQDSTTFALTPIIGWVLKMPSTREECFTLTTSTLDELRLYKSMYLLKIKYSDGMTFPEWMKNIRISGIIIENTIPESELAVLKSYFPNTSIILDKKK